MHETVAASKILADVKKAAKGKTPREVHILVGELSGFTPEEIGETLGAMSGWKVKSSEQKALAECACGYRGKPKVLVRQHGMCLYECPKCGAVPELTKGKDVELKSVGF